MNNIIEYMKLHLISLEQDLENIEFNSDLGEQGYVKKAEIKLLRHLLEVANEFN